MKTFYLSSIFICIFSVAGFAQQKTDVEFGVQAGYNRSGVDLGAGATGDKTISGFNAGIYADMYWNDRWSMKVKVLYDQKGFAQEDVYYNVLIYGLSPGLPAPTITTYENISINYITVPLMANWHFGHARRWYLDFGPYVGFLLSAKDKANSQDLTSQYNTIDIGLAAGIGFKLPVSKRLKLFVEYDAQNGISNAGPKYNGLIYQNVRGSFNIGVDF